MPLPLLVIEVLSDTTRRRGGADDVDVSTELTWQPADGAEPFVLDLGEYFRGALGR